MIAVGHHRVDMRLNHAVRALCAQVEREGMAPQDVVDGLKVLSLKGPKHCKLAHALAAGVACAAFGRLLGSDWAAMGAIFAASAVAQWARIGLIARGINTFVLIAAVAFVASVLAGLGGFLSGSATVGIAMTASVLLLVPGVPSMNAQTDIMEGYPTIGSARFVTVGMILIFITVGMGAARFIVAPGVIDQLVPPTALWHQAGFGALAAAGFGLIFNFSYRTLLWAALAGAVALGVRTVALQWGWPLAAASFVAAIAVALWVEMLGERFLKVPHAGQTLAVAGCIPMVPGGAAAQCLTGLMGLSALPPEQVLSTLVTSASAGLDVVFTVGAIGAGLTLVRSLAPRHEFP